MADEEEIQEDVSQEEEQAVEATEDLAAEATEEQTEEEVESQEAESADDVAADGEPNKGFVSRYWMLGLGFLLAVMGVVAIVGLRTNFLQVYLLGYSDPSPGIGSQESLGYGIASIPYAIGILMVVVWGRRTPALPDMAERMDEGCDVESAEPEVEETPAAEPEEFGHEHLPPHHLSAVEKIEHLTKVYAQGKMSEGLYKENLERFEA
jgi:hypothetical protein